jgi:hypothetical protein
LQWHWPVLVDLARSKELLVVSLLMAGSTSSASGARDRTAMSVTIVIPVHPNFVIIIFPERRASVTRNANDLLACCISPEEQFVRFVSSPTVTCFSGGRMMIPHRHTCQTGPVIDDDAYGAYRYDDDDGYDACLLCSAASRCSIPDETLDHQDNRMAPVSS